MGKSFGAFLVACFALVPALVPQAADALSFEARDFDSLAREADQVVIGTMAAKNSRRTGAREIVTDYRFDHIEVVKGVVASRSLTLTMLGGTVGTDSLAVAGAPTFNLGVRYIVFVSGNGSVMFPLVGGPQGIFQLRKDSVSGISRIHDYAGRPVTRMPQPAGKALAGRVSAEQGDIGETITEAAFVEAVRAKVVEGAK